MDTLSLRLLDPNLHRRGQWIAALLRWISVGVGLVSLAVLWNHPKTHPQSAVIVGLFYVAYTAASHSWLKRNPKGPKARTLKVAHAAVDGVSLGFAAAVTGGLDSPLWLILYPHAFAYSVRGSLALALLVGFLDASIVAGLALRTPGHALGFAHAFALLLCACVAAVTGSYLRSVQRRLYQLNQELSTKNEQLSATIAAQDAIRREQEEAFARLRDSEERYRRLLERIQDGVLIIQDGRVAYANDVFAAMIGAPAEDLPGSDFRAFVPPEDRKELTERYRRWEESQAQSGGFEARLRTRKDETLLVSLRAGSVEFQGKRSVITTIRDMTRERRMEQDVKAHAERLAAINEIANAVNLSLTIEDILRVAAEETRRLVPFDRLTIALLEDDGPGVEVVAVGDRSGRQRAGFLKEQVAWALRRPASWCRGADEPKPEHAEGMLGGVEVASVATVPLLSKERVIGSMNLGRLKPLPFSTWDLAVIEPVARHIAIALDNARLLAAVRRRSREFESLLDIGRGIVQRLDLAELLPLVTRSVNRVMGTNHCILMLRSGDRLEAAAEEGFEAEVLEAFQTLRLGDSLSGWVAREGLPLAVSEIREDARAKFTDVAARFGYRSILCVPLKRGDEVLGTLEVVTKEPRRFGAEEVEVMSAFAAQAAVAIENARLFEATRSHLAQMAEANRRLEELDQLRQQYLRNVSHEFRTPLTVIKGYAEYLLDAGGHDERALREVMKIVVESCDRVIDMVDTLLEVSRIEQGTAAQTLQVQRLDLREVAASSAQGLKALAAKKGISLDLELPAESLDLYGDGGLLQQVVRKLVDNALKYSPGGGRVLVRARTDGEELALEVEDFGIGIPSEHLPRIFEKFYMVDGGVSRRVGGTGVGLYLVREIVRLHNGTVEVRSSPGKGSVFSVRLPRQPQGARPQTALA